MKGTEKITARIESEAKAQAEAILAEAQAQAEAIIREGEASAGELYENALRAGTVECETALERRRRNAEMEAKKNLLAAKQAQVSKAFAKAKELLAELPEADYVKLLARLARDASSTGEELLIFNGRDRAAVGTAVAAAANGLLTEAGRKGGLAVSDETRDIMGGLVLKQGGIEVNCSIENLVDQQRDRSAAAVAAVLFC